MDHMNSSVLRASIIAVVAVALTVLSAMPFGTSDTASSKHTQPPSEKIELSIPTADYHVRYA